MAVRITRYSRLYHDGRLPLSSFRDCRPSLLLRRGDTLPSTALIVRFGSLVAGLAGCGTEPCLSLAYLARCAKAIFRLTAALRFFRGLPVSVRAAGAALPPSIWRISAIRASMRFFWASNPCKAAER